MSTPHDDAGTGKALEAAIQACTDTSLTPLVVNYPAEIGEYAARVSFQRLLQKGLVEPDDMLRYAHNGALFIPSAPEEKP